MACNSPAPKFSSRSETLSNSRPSVFVSNDLMQLIKDPEKTSPSSPLNAHLTTMDDLLIYVKNYIMKNKLYDPANPLKILVHETELGSLLGKSEFSLLDVRDILEKFVYPVEAKNSSEVICSISEKMCVPKKRKLDNFYDSDFSAKRIKGVYDNSSDESMHSMQDYETEFVKDSTPPPLSDDNFSVNGLIFAETFDLDVEYEIETTQRSDNSDFSCESDSDIEDIVQNAVITFIARSSDSDLEYLADGSSDETQSEQEISEKDKWCCSSCLTLNDPRMRCCEACWLTRVGWLSDERQKSDTRERKQKAFAKRNKRKNCLKKRLKKNKDSSNYKFSDLPSVTTESLSTDVLKSPSNTLEADKESTKKTESHTDQQLCLFCCAKPADSSIIHGKLGCKICCFKCGKRLFESNQRCPACRRVIERVVFLFNA